VIANQKAESRKQKYVVGAGRVAMATFCFLLSALCFAKGGAYKSTAHGDPSRGPQRRMDRARGGCGQCHDYSNDGRSVRANDDALFAPNDNELCFTCHALPSDDGVYPGNGTWQRSAHALSRSSIDSGKCGNCHDPHGVRDARGVIPAMLAKRESDLCVGCHDGSRGADIRDQFAKPYWHGMQARGTHDPHEGSDPAKFATAPAQNRHVGCSDCHNSHRAIKERLAPDAPAASSLLAGISRIEVSNSAAGMAPRYTFRGAEDPSPANEFELCFKCHSGWTKQPSGQTDLALVTNPANPSYHPIQASGKNPKIDRNAFVNGYGADSIITCTACHGSNDTNVAGMHGSSYRYLLRKPSGTTGKDDLCFGCHSYDVYTNATATQEVQRASRFNAGQGHAFHVGLKSISCSSCHETHGSTRLPFLIAKNRFPGITSYTQTPTGGTCATTCHAPESYSVTYPR
jgi:predicted CXXCH cytochrome family protein